MEFELGNINQPIDSILTKETASGEIDRAVDESAVVSNELAEDISGIGKKAAERYLLRYEYGFASKDIAERFDVTPQTVSNQVNNVRDKILKYPRLSRIVGTLRAHRTGLHKPEISEGHSWNGDIDVGNSNLSYIVKYRSGNAGRPYSWMYSGSTTYPDREYKFHLICDYMIDAISGVFVKRKQNAISSEIWNKSPVYDSYAYVVYPLPNVVISNNRWGSLIDAVEEHFTYDIANFIKYFINDSNGNLLNEGEYKQRSEERNIDPQRTRSEDLIARMDGFEPDSAIEKYSQSIFVRNNIERLMREYPLENPFDLPDETITQLWNGQPSESDDYRSLFDIDKGSLYQISSSVTTSYKNRKIRANANKHTVATNLWYDGF